VNEYCCRINANIHTCKYQKFSSSLPLLPPTNFRLLNKLKAKAHEQLSLEVNAFKLSGIYIRSTEINTCFNTEHDILGCIEVEVLVLQTSTSFGLEELQL
jgi:hypothetical protein